MINVNSNIQNAYNKSTTQIDKIVMNEQEYYITNVEYTDDCYIDGNIFGSAIARTLSFEIDSSVEIEKKEFAYKTGVLIEDTYNYIDLGNFIVVETEEGDTTEITKVTAMDYMLKTNIEYETNLNYSRATILDVIDEVCMNCGIQLATREFANSDFRVDSNQFEEGTLCRQVIQAIAQISGTVAKIKTDNRLYFINPNTIDVVSKVFDTSDYIEANIKRLTHPINLVSLRNSQIEGENITERDAESIARDGENSLIIQDNPFAYNQDKRIALITELFNAVKGFEYKAFSLNYQSLPYMETLDKVQIKDIRGNVYNSFVFRFNHKSPNGLDSTIEAPSETKATLEYQNLPEAIEIAKRTEILVDKQNQIVQSVVTNVSQQNSKIALIQQTVDELNSKISDIADITVSKESTTGYLEFDDINQSEPISIIIRPLGDNIDYRYPCSRQRANNNLLLKKRTLRFTNTETNEIFDYELPMGLLYYDSENYDEFILNYDSLSCYIVKKCALDPDGNGENVYRLAQEQIINLEFPHINLSDGNYTVQILKYSNNNGDVPYGAYLFVRLMAQNIYTSQFATHAELSSEITQLAGSIELSVNEKLDNYSTTTEMNSAITVKANEISSVVSQKAGREEVCSIISQSADSISITSNRLSIDSSNFKLTEQGNITATGGKIGGFNLGSTRFSNLTQGIYNYNNYDLTMAMAMIMDFVNREQTMSEICDTNNDGSISPADYVRIRNILLGTTTNTKQISGEFSINSTDPKDAIKIEKDGRTVISMGVGGLNANCATIENLICGTSSYSSSGSSFSGVTINGVTGRMSCISNNSCSTYIENSGIVTPRVTQTSLEEEKKNFEKLKSGLNIIKKIDVYKYNLKEEADDAKKHIGFIIGDNFRYSNEITSQKNDGVDIYSFISVCCKAIQEQQEQIDSLKKEMEVLKNGIQ